VSLRAGLDIRNRVQAVNIVTGVVQYSVWAIRTLCDQNTVTLCDQNTVRTEHCNLSRHSKGLKDFCPRHASIRGQQLEESSAGQRRMGKTF
jgi:hypothetical protein